MASMRGMSLLFTLLLIACGLLAASGLIVQKRPDARVVFDKMAPFAGGMGLGLLVIGILHLLKYVLPHLFTMLGSLSGWIAIATVVTAILLGFLLSFGLLSSWVGRKSPEAVAKADQLRARIAPVQIPLGIAGVVFGIWSLI
jgi:hypothetical protein